MTTMTQTPDIANKPSITLGILGGLSAGGAGLAYMVGNLGTHPATMGILPVIIVASLLPAVRLLQKTPKLRALYAITFAVVFAGIVAAFIASPLAGANAALLALGIFVVGAALTLITYRRHTQLED